MPTKASTSPKAKAPAKSTAKPVADPALDLENTGAQAETGSTSNAPTASEPPETGASEPETSSEAETVSASDAAKPEQDADKTSETDAAAIPAATGVRQIYLLKASSLGPDGKVIRLTHRKISDLGLKEGEDFRAPTALELAIGG